MLNAGLRNDCPKARLASPHIGPPMRGSSGSSAAAMSRLVASYILGKPKGEIAEGNAVSCIPVYTWTGPAYVRLHFQVEDTRLVKPQVRYSHGHGQYIVKINEISTYQINCYKHITQIPKKTPNNAPMSSK